MKKQHFLLFLPFILWQCQHDTLNRTQFGFGAKMSLNLSGAQNTALQMSITGGASQSLLYNSAMFYYQPSLIFYQGGLGSKATFKDINNFRFEFVNSIGVNFRCADTVTSEKEQARIPIFRPLITWSASNATALSNPYFYSATVSTNIIWTNAQNADGTKQMQRVGFIGLFTPLVSAGYSNDGPPFEDWRSLGDTYDRYWTGRGFLRVELDIGKNTHKRLDNATWQFTLEYDKFTGFSRDLYEVANVLGLRFVPYGDESAYNKSQWSFKFLNRPYNIGGSVTLSNFENKDIQHLIHRVGKYPFHGSVYEHHFGLGVFGDYQNKIP